MVSFWVGFYLFTGRLVDMAGEGVFRANFYSKSISHYHRRGSNRRTKDDYWTG